MFRLWGKIIKNNRIISDQVFELNTRDLSVKNLSLEEKIDQGLESLCYQFDIQKPMWFNDANKDFSLVGKTRFTGQHFMESIDFDCFEIEVIEDK